jgi:Protein of unknown function (DUF2934)
VDLEIEIRKLAYQLYEKSGNVGGRDLDNWLKAEKIILGQQGMKKYPETAPSPPSKKKRATTSKKASKRSKISFTH